MASSKLKLVSVADILTLMNGVCGLLAIIAFIYFYPDITYGTGLIFLGLVFDGMDGAAARKFGTKHDFGRHLDSISDSITFCLAPSVMLAVVFYIPVDNAPFFSIQTFQLPSNVLLLLACTLMIFFGFKRLVNFTMYGYKLKRFLGLATPAMGFLVIVISHILDPHRPENDSNLIIYFSLIIVIMGSVLIDSNIIYPKIRGKLGALLAIAIILSLLSIEIQKWFGFGSADSIFIYYRIMSFFGLGIVITYVFISPLFVAATSKK